MDPELAYMPVMDPECATDPQPEKLSVPEPAPTGLIFLELPPTLVPSLEFLASPLVIYRIPWFCLRSSLFRWSCPALTRLFSPVPWLLLILLVSHLPA